MIKPTSFSTKLSQYILPNRKFQIETCHRYLESVESKITKDKFSEIPKYVKWIIRTLTPTRVKELAKLNCFAAEKTKNYLDNRFGKNNYTLISIGRSTASIAETLKSMGVDTKILPLSDLRNGLPQNIDNIKTFKSFLKSIGLSKKALEKNPNRTYIITDYTFTGKSLRKAEEFLKRDSLLGNAQNLISYPIKSLLYKDYDSKKFNTIFANNRFKDFSPVGRLSIFELGNIFRQSTSKTAKEYQYNISNFMRKLFKFNVFDSLERQNFKKCKPTREIKAITKHNSSPIKKLIKAQTLNIYNHQW